jgi:hypothetical protein
MRPPYGVAPDVLDGLVMGCGSGVWVSPSGELRAHGWGKGVERCCASSEQAGGTHAPGPHPKPQPKAAQARPARRRRASMTAASRVISWERPSR